jgi:uric acid-xanthine permease
LFSPSDFAFIMSAAPSTQSNQPEPVKRPYMDPAQRTGFRSQVAFAKDKVTTKEGWFGQYDYGWLCLPTLPFQKGGPSRSPPFYGLDDDMPLLLAITTGLQHALAMLAGMSLHVSQY